MPLKRPAPSALDASSQASVASSSSPSSANGLMLKGTPLPSTTYSNSVLKRVKGYIANALSPSRKRPKLDQQSKPYSSLLLAPTPLTPTPESASSTVAASGFLDLTPSKTPPCNTAATDKDTQILLLSSSEGAIRDPLARTLLDSPPLSTASAMIIDTRSSSEEAAETQIQHALPPPSRPVASSESVNTELQPEHEAALDPFLVKDEPAVTNSQSDLSVDDGNRDANEAGPTDDDVDHIQAVADAKVGEHVEGLLDWSRSLSSHEPQSPSAPAFDAGETSTDSPTEHQQDAETPKDSGSEVIDLVSDSDETSSDSDDPDKENDVSLINATPRFDSDAQLPALPGQAASRQPSRPSGSSFSLIGPMSKRLGRKSLTQPPSESRFKFLPTANGSYPADISATETVRGIGRQSYHVQPGRRSIPFTSTPLHTDRPGQRDRSFSFSSDASMPSIAASSTITPSSAVYRKRDPIFGKQHLQKVDQHLESTIRHSIETARQRINKLRSSSRKPLLRRKHFEALTAKTQQVHALIAQDNPRDASISDFLEAMTQKFMRQRQLDAQTAVLPLPPLRLQEKQRIDRERRLRERKLRGILGRQRLPTQLDYEQEQAASMAFSRRGKVSDIPGASVIDKDVQKLRPGQWLNDEVINFYGTLVLIRANEADKKRTEAMAAAKGAPVPPAPAPNSNSNSISNGKITSKEKSKAAIPQRPYDKSLDAFWRVHFFSSFFWTNLKSKGFDGVKRWTRRVDLFSKDIILFPINIGNAHWVCGAINMRKHRFEYYDSLGAANKSVFSLMRDYLTQEARDKKKKEIDLRGWTDHFTDESPQQENAFDCGVFASQTLEQISRRDPHSPIPLDPPTIVWKGESLDEGAEKMSLRSAGDGDEFDELEYEWNFSQENMPYLRKRMAYEIFSKQLLD